VTSEVACYARLHSRNYSSAYASKLFGIVRVTLCAQLAGSEEKAFFCANAPQKHGVLYLKKPVSLKLNALSGLA